MRRYFRRPRRSWHRFVTYSRTGRVIARCGYQPAPLAALEWSDDPALNAKGCESCSRLTLRDEDASTVEDDPVANEPPVEDDPVPG